MRAKPERWLTIEEARKVVSVSRRTIYNWMDEGRITTRRTAGNGVRVLEASLWKTGPGRRVRERIAE